MIIFGAGVIGEATLYACRKAGMPVECFIDDRIRKPVGGVEVHFFKDLWIYPKETLIYLTSPNIADMIEPLEKAGYKNWQSCGAVLKDFDISEYEFQSINGSNEESRYSHEHIKYLIRTCLHHHENHANPERLTVQSVDLMITEKCTMKCRDCSNLMQYYETPENADLNQMFSMIDGLCSKMDEIYEFRVIGGEPFVHKEIHSVVQYLCAMRNVRKVSIFTNATIVPREHQWFALQHEKVRFFITDYDELSRNIRPLVTALHERDIAYVSEKANGWTDCASLEKHNRTHAENEDIWGKCCAKNLATLADGRLYRCPFAANAFKLRAVPDYKGDYLVVEKAGREDILQFLRSKRFLDTCDHCNGRSYNATVIKAGIQTKTPLKYKKYEIVEEHGA